MGTLSSSRKRHGRPPPMSTDSRRDSPSAAWISSRSSKAARTALVKLLLADALASDVEMEGAHQQLPYVGVRVGLGRAVSELAPGLTGL